MGRVGSDRANRPSNLVQKRDRWCAGVVVGAAVAESTIGLPVGVAVGAGDTGTTSGESRAVTARAIAGAGAACVEVGAVLSWLVVSRWVHSRHLQDTVDV